MPKKRRRQKKKQGFVVKVGNRKLFKGVFPSKAHGKIAILDAIYGASTSRRRTPSQTLKIVKRYAKARVVKV